MIDDVAAREALGPAGGEWGRSPSGRPTLRRVVAAQVAAGLVSLGVMGALEAIRGREHEPTSAPRAAPAGHRGGYWLLARARAPWAEVVVDGYSVDTTPSSHRCLAPGTHYVRLRNPSFVTEDRAVQIASGATVWIDVDLQPASGGRRED
ncbi:MAG: PEGA domain-containing protein [Polyangiales bacterium]